MNSNYIPKRSNIINTVFLDTHRNYGALPMMDIDCMYFKNNKPCLMLELKYGSTPFIDLSDKQFTRLRIMAGEFKTPIPAFCVMYYLRGLNEYNNKTNEFGDYNNYFVIPINNEARGYLFNGCAQGFTEKKFVELLYRIKNQPISLDLTLDDNWNSNLPIPLIKAEDIGTSVWDNQTKQYETRIYQ